MFNSYVGHSMQRVGIFAAISRNGEVFSIFLNKYFMLTRSDCGYRERKCADTIGTVLVPWAGHFHINVFFK